MPYLPLALPPQSNKGEYEHAGVAALINCYATLGGDEQKSKLRIRAASGLDDIVTVGVSGGVRRLFEVDGVVYGVIGRALVQIDSGGLATIIGGVPSDGYVGMARNQRDAGVQVIVVCDGLKWTVVGGSQTPISDPDLPPAIDVCVINQSAIWACSDGRMFRSEINDASAIDGLDVTEAESSPDGLVRVVDRGGELIAIGTKSTEFYQDIGGEAFGFSRTHTINVGAIGPAAVTKATVMSAAVSDTVAWCATDGTGRSAGIVMLQGYQASKISTPYVDRLVDQVSDKGSIVASAWVERGHGMIAWRLPTTAIVYDTATQMWHERQSRTSAGAVTTWHVAHTAVLNGRVMAGHASSPTVYWLDPDVYDEAGDEMVMTIRTPPLNSFPGRVEVSEINVDMLPGVGLATGASADIDPVVSMRYSNDGRTWSSIRTRPLGRQGQTSKRAYWSRLGTHDSVTFEFSCSAAVAREVLSASWDGKVLPR